MKMKRQLKALGLCVLVLATGFAGFVWWILQPRVEPQPLPAALVEADSEEGRRLLATAGDYLADYPALAKAWRPQQLASYCGVASGATILTALGQPTTQDAFFTPAAARVRSRMAVTFGGMSLSELAGLLAAHGLEISTAYAAGSTPAEFRAAVMENLASSGDFMLVNYQREVLEQGRVGHISPLGAYHRESDRVLVMDTAAHKYPHTWVPLEALFAAMNEVDAASGRSRGFLSARLTVSGRD
jgi:hypothetical protein